MKEIEFANYSELSDYIYETALIDCQEVMVVSFINDINEIAKLLEEYKSINFKSIDIKNNFNNREYYLKITPDMNIEIDYFNKNILQDYYGVSIFCKDIDLHLVPDNDCEQIIFSINNHNQDECCKECCYDCSNCYKIKSINE